MAPTSPEALRGLFDKALDQVEHRDLGLVFTGLAGYLRVRSRTRDELLDRAIRIETDLVRMGQWLDGAGKKNDGTEVERDGRQHLEGCWRETDQAYRLLLGQSLIPWASEMAGILRAGLVEHLNAIDALAGLAALRIKERP